MDKNICNICGGTYVYKNGKWVCEACGAYKPEELSNEEDTLYYNASQALRLCNFEEAENLFSDIVVKYPHSSRNYWGLLLSKYGIKYETDYDGKKIPTCYATSYASLYEDKNYKLALRYGSKDEKDYYEKQAEIIEKNRIEWVEKASKLPPYDIFISYKDTETENGIERTRDSYEAQEVYHFLKSKGYNVFFSRISLNCYGEKYEPYIFNALNTAKIMIIYGSKEEYITSTWVKNEWSRFAKRIVNKEKASNSLILLYKGLNPGTLPNPLKSLQSIDVSNITWMDSLESYVSSVLKNTPSGKKGLKKAVIEQEIGKKATKLSSEHDVSNRIIGAEAIEGKSYTVNEKLNIADKFIDNGVFDLGLDHINKILENEPLDGDAIFRKFLCINKLKGLDAVLTMNLQKVTDLELIEQALRHCSENYALLIIETFYKFFQKLLENPLGANAQKAYKLCDIIFVYEYSKRNEYLEQFIQKAIEYYDFTLFEILVKIISIDDIDKYIYWLTKLLSHEVTSGNFSKASEIANSLISVDEGNNVARRALIRIATCSTLDPSLVEYDANIDKLKTYESLKDLLKYQNQDQQKQEIEAILKAIPYDSLNLDFYTELLKFYPENIKCFSSEIFKKGNIYLETGKFSAAKYLFELLSSIDSTEATFYYYIIMAKCEVKNEKELIYSRDILSFDEYIPMLNHADDEQTKFFMDIVKKQRKYHEEDMEFKQERDNILSVYSTQNSIHSEMKKCEKRFNKANKKSKTNSFPKALLFFVVLFNVLFFIFKDFLHSPNMAQEILGKVFLGIAAFFDFVFILRLFIFIGNKITSKSMFNKYANLRRKEKKLLQELAVYKNKYEYFDHLVEEYSPKK